MYGSYWISFVPSVLFFVINLVPRKIVALTIYLVPRSGCAIKEELSIQIAKVASSSLKGDSLTGKRFDVNLQLQQRCWKTNSCYKRSLFLSSQITLPLHIYWVPCAIARFASVKISLWIKHLFFLRHLTACYFFLPVTAHSRRSTWLLSAKPLKIL